MRFTKIKYSEKNGVHLEWSTPAEKRPEDLVEHTLNGKEAPAPEFDAALQAFRGEVLVLLELPGDYTDGLRVIGLSVNYEDDGRKGLVVTCVKQLERTNAPLVLNTPHLREASDEDTGNYLPDRMVELVREAERQAAAYVPGARLQKGLFAESAGR